MSKTIKYNIIAIWVVVGVLIIITLSGLSSTKDNFKRVLTLFRQQERVNDSLIQQFKIQGELNENRLQIDSSLIDAMFE